jgi:alcohol dehydrogenase YqhD (iron-dependent ADH family)
MLNFEYQNPTRMIFGNGSISKIGSEIKKYDVKKVLMLYGKGSIFKNGAYEQAVASLKENGIEWIELGGVKPNPVLSKVTEAVELCRKENIDGILAIGGGSVLDSAKAIGAGVYLDDIWSIFDGRKIAEKSLPVFTILTISATGSEMNSGGVITKEDENKKWPFRASLQSFPKASILDPSLQAGLPADQTVNGAVDAISHIMEYYFDGAKDSEIQDEIAESLIRVVMKHVQILLADPDNYDSRAQLAWCATLALNGSTAVGRNYGDWSTHMLEHSVSAFYDIAHGAGLAIMFPAWMNYVYKYNVTKFVRFAEKIFGITEGSDEEKARRGIEELKKFFKKIGAPVSLREIGVEEKDIVKLADNASLRVPLGRLKQLNKSDIEDIFRLAY